MSQHSIKYVNSIITGLKNKNGERVNCALIHNPEKAEIYLLSSTEPPNIEHLKLSENVQYKLGLTDDTVFPNTKYRVKQQGFLQYSPKLLTANGAPDIRAGQYSIFVLCGIVQPQIIGNTMAPILRVVSTRGTYNDVINEQFDNAHYIPVLNKEFSCIEINISDDRGSLVNFPYGKVIVKLHFRMKI